VPSLPRQTSLPLLFLLMKMLLAGLSFMMIWLDVAVFDTQILEISFTEITQELMLFACALLFWCAPQRGARNGFDYLAAGFFGCLLMRELDGLFDPISHSAWCWPFLAIAAFSIGNALHKKRRAGTFKALTAFIATPTFATLATGFAVLLFSRVFGMGSLWHQVLGEGYARMAKTAVEEGVELMAYSIWLAASVEYFVRAKLTSPLSTSAPYEATARPQIA
jgi:hypothetical protein